MLDKIKNIFKTKDERTANVARNIAASAVMKILSLVCSLVIVPITVNYLDKEQYGIWMAMTSILYWVAFFDVGLGNGMRNYMSAAISKGDYAKARSYFSTALFILSGIAIVMAVIAIPMVQFVDLNKIFNTNSLDERFLTFVMTMAIVLTLVQFVVKNVGMAYIAMQKYAINDLIVFLGSFASIIAVFILTKTTESNLAYVVAAFTGCPVLLFILAAFPLFKSHPEMIPKWKDVDTSAAKKIITKGLGFFVIQITSCLFVFGSANVIILHFNGGEQVTIYNLAYKLFNLLTVAYTIYLSPLWNAYTDAAVKQDYVWVKKTFRRSLYVWVLSCIAGVIVLSVSGWFFDKWIGDTVTIPFIVSLNVLIYVCMFNFANCVAYLLNGFNKIRMQIITSIVTTVIYIGVVLCFGDCLGIIGVCLAMSGVYLTKGIIHLYQANLIINQKAKGIWNK